MMRRVERLSTGRLQELCIERSWFTRGGNSEYKRLFELAHDYNQHDNEKDRMYKLYAMADRIWSYSDVDVTGFMTLNEIMDAIQFCCISIRYEAE